MSMADGEVRQDYLPTVRVSIDTGVMVDATDVAEAVVLDRSGRPAVMILPPGETDTLTDREVAVVIDSLADMRDRIRGAGGETPTIDGALDKLHRLITPGTAGMRVIALDRGPAPGTTEYANVHGRYVHELMQDEARGGRDWGRP